MTSQVTCFYCRRPNPLFTNLIYHTRIMLVFYSQSSTAVSYRVLIAAAAYFSNKLRKKALIELACSVESRSQA